MIGNLRSLMQEYGHHISFVVCVIGFTLDAAGLPSIDHPFTQIISFLYFAIAMIGIVLIELLHKEGASSPSLQKVGPILPLIVQFVLGGLMSIVFVYYFRSSALVVSWPLLLVLALLMIGNEVYRKELAQLEFEVAVLFTLILFFLVFYVPLVVGTVSVLTFIIAFVVSVVIILLFVGVLYAAMRRTLRAAFLRIIAPVICIGLVVFTLYITNIIPPIPLVLRNAGVYHQVLRSEGGYTGFTEPYDSFLHRYLGHLVYHRSHGEPVYFFSAVFAPVVLSTPLIHEWQYWDERDRKWVTASEVEFPISGGRDGGFRGYSVKENIFDGEWRVLVKTRDGRIVGRTTFTIVSAGDPPTLYEQVL